MGKVRDKKQSWEGALGGLAQHRAQVHAIREKAVEGVHLYGRQTKINVQKRDAVQEW